MDVKYADERLRDLLGGSPGQLVAKYGAKQAKRLAQRIQALKTADTLLDIATMPGRLHALSADRAGCLALDLVHPKRLVFTPELGAHLAALERWGEVKSVVILEIVDYHS